MDVDGADRQAPDRGTVDPDVLEVVAGMLFDEPGSVLGPERVDPALDEGGDAILIALDERGGRRLEPSIEAMPERAV